MNAKQITGNDLHDLDDPQDGWYIIEAAGQYATLYGKGEGQMQFIQNLTPGVLARVAAAGVPEEGLPIDCDHLSADMGNTTEAMGWVRELALCGGDLAAYIEWTPPGLELVQGRLYKHFSTVYPVDLPAMRRGTYEPGILIGLALTNQPNNKEGQPPIANRHPAGTTTTINNTMTPEQEQELALLLGLDANAGFEDIKAAVTKMFDSVQNAEEETAKELIENADTDGELDEDEKDMYTKELVANRAKGMALLNKRLGRKPAVHNRGGVIINAGRPRSVLGGKSDPRRLFNRAKALQLAGEHKGDWVKCYNQARTERK